MTFRWNLLLPVLAVFSSTAFTEQLLPEALSPAWESLQKTHPSLRAASLRRSAQEAALSSAKAQRLPHLDATAYWQIQSTVPTLDLSVPLPTGQTMDISRDLGDHDRTEAALTASWFAFTGFARTHAIKAQSANLRAADLDQEQYRRDLLLQMGLLHWNFQAGLLEHLLRVERAQVRRKHAHTLASLAAGGSATRAQVLAAEAEAARAAADTAQSLRILDSLQAEFHDLTGSDYPESLMRTVDTDNPDASGKYSPLPAVEALTARAQALQAGAEASEATDLPWVGLSAGYHMGDPGLNQMSTGMMHWGVAAIQVQWSLFDGGVRKADAQRLKREAQALDADAQRIRRSVETKLKALASEAHSIQTELAALDAGIEAAQAGVSSLEAGDAGGVTTADDRRDAELRLAELQRRRQQALVHAAVTHLRIAYTSGQALPFLAKETP